MLQSQAHSKTATVEQLLCVSAAIKSFGLRIFPKRPGYAVGQSDYFGISALSTIDQVRTRINEEKHHEILPMILHITRDQEARELVDRIYAILGIVDDFMRKQIVVDYSPESRRELWRVYLQFYKVCVAVIGHSAFLTLSSEQIISQLPSWCLNLNSRGERWPITRTFTGAGSQVYRERYWKPDVPPIMSFEDSDELQTIGASVDFVINTKIIRLDSSQVDGVINSEQVVLEDEGNCAKLLRADLPASSVSQDHYARTLVASFIGNRNAALSAESYEQLFRKSTEYLGRAKSEQMTKWPLADQDFRDFRTHLLRCWRGRSFFTTREGRIGLGPGSMMSGDLVIVVIGGSIPYTLRNASKATRYHILGGCYIEGLMDGEVFELRDFEKAGYETFMLV